MRKLAILLALWGVGFPSLAMAADVVTVFCASSPAQGISSTGSKGVTVPPSCNANPGQSTCSQCLADLLSAGFTLAGSYPLGTASASPFCILTK